LGVTLGLVEGPEINFRTHSEVFSWGSFLVASSVAAVVGEASTEGAIELEILSHYRTVNGELLVTVLRINIANIHTTIPTTNWIAGDDLISDEPGINMGDVILNDDLLRNEDRLWDFGDTVVVIFIAETGWTDRLVIVLTVNVTVGNVSANYERTIGMDDGSTVAIRIALAHTVVDVIWNIGDWAISVLDVSVLSTGIANTGEGGAIFLVIWCIGIMVSIILTDTTIPNWNWSITITSHSTSIVSTGIAGNNLVGNGFWVARGNLRDLHLAKLAVIFRTLRVSEGIGREGTVNLPVRCVINDVRAAPEGCTGSEAFKLITGNSGIFTPGAIDAWVVARVICGVLLNTSGDIVLGVGIATENSEAWTLSDGETGSTGDMPVGTGIDQASSVVRFREIASIWLVMAIRWPDSSDVAVLDAWFNIVRDLTGVGIDSLTISSVVAWVVTLAFTTLHSVTVKATPTDG